MEGGPQQLGKFFILAGGVLVLAGVLFLLFGRLGLFKLPGDLVFGGKTWRVYLPITSSLILSILVTLILWLIFYFRR
jgi:hypothetical protein